MKKKVILLVCIFVCIFNVFLNGSITRAKSDNTQMIGLYTINVPVNKTIKVYVQENLVDYLKENGIQVFSEHRKGWWFIKDYYYIANKNVNKIVESRSIMNDIDSLRFMVNELENMAKEINANQYKNIALGYIRSINTNYVDGYVDRWSVTAGSIDKDAINKINEKEKSQIGLRFNEYFAQFVCSGTNTDLYNKALHGAIRERFKNMDDEPKKLIDPVNKNKSIDLIHLFGSVDGIYCKTNPAPVTFGNNKMERDIVSWNGDLQQAVLNINKRNIDYSCFTEVENQKMKFIFRKGADGSDQYECPEDDILADIDAMNMTKLFIDHDNTTIASAISGYYGLISDNERSRYKTFIKTVLIDEECNQKTKNLTEVERFELEVYNQFNIRHDGGIYYNWNFYDTKIDFVFAIMRGKTNLVGNSFGEFPPYEIRFFVAKSFVEYVENYL